MNYTLHLKNHAGWHTQFIEAESISEAIKIGLGKRAAFLEKEYTGKYRIEHDDPNDEYPRFRVVWDSDEPKDFILGESLKKGDVWWGARFRIGKPDDCQKCGGTGKSHYEPWMQCWECGDRTKRGKGTGKCKAK